MGTDWLAVVAGARVGERRPDAYHPDVVLMQMAQEVIALRERVAVLEERLGGPEEPPSQSA